MWTELPSDSFVKRRVDQNEYIVVLTDVFFSPLSSLRPRRSSKSMAATDSTAAPMQQDVDVLLDAMASVPTSLDSATPPSIKVRLFASHHRVSMNTYSTSADPRVSSPTPSADKAG
jgi:hypothetical protein